MEAALAWRRRAFLVLLGASALLTLAVLALAPFLESDKEPDILTWGLFAFFAVELPVLLAVFFSEKAWDRSVTTMRDKETFSIEQFGKALSYLGGSLAQTPIGIGLVLFVMSGDAWRFYLFLPLTAGASALFWQRIEAGIGYVHARHESTSTTAPSPDTKEGPN